MIASDYIFKMHVQFLTNLAYNIINFLNTSVPYILESELESVHAGCTAEKCNACGGSQGKSSLNSLNRRVV